MSLPLYHTTHNKTKRFSIIEKEIDFCYYLYLLFFCAVCQKGERAPIMRDHDNIDPPPDAQQSHFPISMYIETNSRRPTKKKIGIDVVVVVPGHLYNVNKNPENTHTSDRLIMDDAPSLVYYVLYSISVTVFILYIYIYLYKSR